MAPHFSTKITYIWCKRFSFISKISYFKKKIRKKLHTIYESNKSMEFFSSKLSVWMKLFLLATNSQRKNWIEVPIEMNAFRGDRLCTYASIDRYVNILIMNSVPTVRAFKLYYCISNNPAFTLWSTLSSLDFKHLFWIYFSFLLHMICMAKRKQLFLPQFSATFMTRAHTNLKKKRNTADNKISETNKEYKQKRLSIKKGPTKMKTNTTTTASTASTKDC